MHYHNISVRNERLRNTWIGSALSPTVLSIEHYHNHYTISVLSPTVISSIIIICDIEVSSTIIIYHYKTRG